MFTNWLIWSLERLHRLARHQRQAPSGNISIHPSQFSMRMTFPVAMANQQALSTGQCISQPIPPSLQVIHRLAVTNTLPVYLLVATEQIHYQAVPDFLPTSMQGPITGATYSMSIPMLMKPVNRIMPELVARLRFRKISPIWKPPRSAPPHLLQPWVTPSPCSTALTISGPIIRVHSTGNCIFLQIRPLRHQIHSLMNLV